MITLEEKAYAKLNLTLDVGPKREDGYHEISTVMQPLTLCDDLTITLGTGEPWQVRGDVPEVPTGRKNLCYKAAKAFYNATGTDPDGITVEIVKRIPMGAGLGGGSADAAAVLRALNRHEGNRFTQAELEKLGLEVGSDVPFCLRNKIALAEGRGERLSEVPAMPPLLLCAGQAGFPGIDRRPVLEAGQHPGSGPSQGGALLQGNRAGRPARDRCQSAQRL